MNERNVINMETIDYSKLPRGKVDLRNCQEGDILMSVLGGTLRYLRPTTETEYLDHKVQYLHVPNSELDKLGDGSRTHDGFVFAKNRIPETDHDIVMIIPKDEYNGPYGK